MKKIIVLISLTLFLLTGTNLYSQEPPPPVAQGQVQLRKLDSESSTRSNIETKDKKNTTPNTMPMVVSSIKETKKSDATTKHGYEESSNSKFGAIENNRITRYTYWLMVFTGLLVICNIMLWITTAKAIKLARKEFIATHRPKLRVHSVCLEKLSSTPNFTNSSPPITHQINCSIDNIGGSPATITKISITFKRLNDPLPIPSYGEPIFIKKSIACGESITESCDVEAFVIDCNIERSLNDLYLFGYIDYLDNIGTIRRTAFCRRYIQETKRFIKINDEDYEYSY